MHGLHCFCHLWLARVSPAEDKTQVPVCDFWKAQSPSLPDRSYATFARKKPKTKKKKKTCSITCFIGIRQSLKILLIMTLALV